MNSPNLNMNQISYNSIINLISICAVSSQNALIYRVSVFYSLQLLTLIHANHHFTFLRVHN